MPIWGSDFDQKHPPSDRFRHPFLDSQQYSSTITDLTALPPVLFGTVFLGLEQGAHSSTSESKAGNVVSGESKHDSNGEAS